MELIRPSHGGPARDGVARCGLFVARRADRDAHHPGGHLRPSRRRCPAAANTGRVWLERLFFLFGAVTGRDRLCDEFLCRRRLA